MLLLCGTQAHAAVRKSSCERETVVGRKELHKQSFFSPTSCTTCTFPLNVKYHFPKAKYSREDKRYPLPSTKEQCPRQCHGTGSHYWPCQSSLGPPDGKRGTAVWRHHSCPPRQHLRRTSTGHGDRSAASTSYPTPTGSYCSLCFYHQSLR